MSVRLRQRKNETPQQMIARFTADTLAEARKQERIETLKRERERVLHEIGLGEKLGPTGLDSRYIHALGGSFLRQRTGQEIRETAAANLADVDAEIARIEAGGEF